MSKQGLLIILCSTLLLLESGCSRLFSSGPKQASTQGPIFPVPGSNGNGSFFLLNPYTGDVTQTGTVGIRDFVQMLPAMSAVTGITSADTQYAPISRYYYGGGGLGPGMTHMSVDGSATGISSATSLTYTAMAGMFCDAIYLKESAMTDPSQRTFYSSLGSNTAVAPTALTPSVRATIINNFASQFWGRMPTSTESAALSTAMDDVQSGLASYTGGAGLTRYMLFAACTAALASPDFLEN